MEPTLCDIIPRAIAAPSAILVGRAGHRYAVGSAPIGSGAQAEVWPALRDDGEAVAIKLARPGRAAVDALDAEGRWLEALAESGATCTVPCFDHVDWDGRPGLVLPRLPRHVGELVRARADADPGRAIEAVLGVAAQLAHALAMLHAAELGAAGRLVHRDVKPENVLVDNIGALRLADLGGCLLVGAGEARDLGVFGSPKWAPPDQMLPGVAEPNRTWDTYAACVMIFAWITGDRPSFQVDPTPRLTPLGALLLERLRALAAAEGDRRSAASDALFRTRFGVRAEHVIANDVPPGLPRADRARLAKGVAALADPARYGDEALEAAVDALTDILGRGLAPHPADRYADAAPLAHALESVLRGLGSARRHRTLTERAPPVRVFRPREAARVGAGVPVAWRSAVAGFALVGALAGTGFSALSDRLAAPPPSARVVTVRVDGGRGLGEAFRIGRTEVSNQAWDRCVAAGVCPAQDGGMPGLHAGAGQPVVGVSWHGAGAWCAWDGGRLPTEAEWERAAFGAPEGAARSWPWGAAPLDCTRANVASCGLAMTAAVDGFAAGASAWGAVQMYGNAWEWTATRGAGDARVLRGGAFDTPAPDLEAGARRRDAPGAVDWRYSFRCVYPL